MTMHPKSHSAPGTPHLGEIANDDLADLAGLGSGAGATLRAARASKGIALEEAAEALKIKAAHLAALEQNRFQDLPCAAYASGFLRSYAAYLGIDRQEIMRQYKARMQGRHAAPHLEMPKPLAEGRLPGLLTLASAFFGMAVVFTLWQWYARPANLTDDATPPPAALAAPYVAGTASATKPAQVSVDTAEQSKPAPPAAKPSAQIDAQVTMANPGATPPGGAPAPSTPPANSAPAKSAVPQASVSGKPQPVAPSAPDQPAASGAAGIAYGTPDSQSHVVLYATDDAWIQISDTDGNDVFSRVLKKGDSYIVPPRGDLVLTTNNAGGLRFTVDGVLTQAAGVDGESLRDAPLDGTRQR